VALEENFAPERIVLFRGLIPNLRGFAIQMHHFRDAGRVTPSLDGRFPSEVYMSRHDLTEEQRNLHRNSGKSV